MLISGLIYFVSNKQDTFNVIEHTNLYAVLAMSLTYAINYLALGHIYNYPLKKLDIHLNFNQWFGLTNVSNLFNLILPAKGGTALRWLYLWEIHKLPTKIFLSINLFGTAVGMITMGYIGLLANQILSGLNDSLIIHMDSIFWTLLLVGAFIVVMMSRGQLKRFKLLSTLPEEVKSAKVFLSIVICFTVITLLYPIRTYLSFQSLGLELTFVQGIEISLISLIISILPIMPGNLGVKEVAFAYLAHRYGISPEMAVLSSLVERLGLYIFILPTGVLAYFSVFLNTKGNRSVSEISSLMREQNINGT